VTSTELPAPAAGPAAPAADPVLTVVQHDEDVPLGRFAGWLDGVQIRTVRAFAGDRVPVHPADVGAGLIVLGGHADAYADTAAPWLPATRALLAAAVAAEVPTLGICLGAQLLAVACGGRVQVAAPPGREAGVVAVHWRRAAAGDPVVGVVAGSGRPTPMPSMHADAVVDLPPGAAWLGASAMYPYQAFRLGSAWGLQFHPEAGLDTLLAWAGGYAGADLDAGVDPAAVAAGYAAAEPEITAAGRALAAGFAAVVRQSGTRSSASTIVYA
jgi:GMP synthase (glutamine-hydrolysing)